MSRLSCLLLLGLAGLVPCRGAEAPPKSKYEVKMAGKDGVVRLFYAIHRVGQEKPLVVCQTPWEERPYLHPILAPDGKGVLTEHSPSHHRHQTGLYVGFLRVNGRDYFHNRDQDYFQRRVGSSSVGRVEQPTWSVAYDWLGRNKAKVLTETQNWKLSDRGAYYVLDLDWNGKALVDVTFGRYDYGGLFLRMPWRSKSGGKAVNSEGDINDKAEGKKARWVDVGMPIEGRPDWGHIAILDHKANKDHPVLWRVDGQLGVGPAPSRAAEWKLKKGEMVRLRYRLVVYTGEQNRERVEAEWKQFTGP